MKTISEVTSAVGNGMTVPFYARINEEMYVIKSIHNPEGYVALFNEYIGYSLVSMCAITLPEFGFACVDETTLNHELSSIGLCFFTKYVRGDIVRSTKQLKYVEKDTMLKIAVLDVLLCNTDRNLGNMLIHVGKSGIGTVYPIDYSHAFEKGVLWEFGQFSQIELDELSDVKKYLTKLYDAYLLGFLHPSHTEIKIAVQEIKDALILIDVKALIYEIPSEIIQKIAHDDLVAFEKFIVKRIASLDEIEDQLIAFFLRGE